MSFRSARIRAGKTVTEVCNHLGITDAAVYFWETGKTSPRIKMLVRIAEFYGCSVDELLEGNPDGKEE